jgi:hypothetical protein
MQVKQTVSPDEQIENWKITLLEIHAMWLGLQNIG